MTATPGPRTDPYEGGWLAGCGIGDITGEAAECGMLGYGKPDQQTAGLHTRLRSRAFVLVAGGRRLLLVVNEMPLPMDSVTDEVLRRLAARYGDTYGPDNMMITATHTHCAPGGYSAQLTYNANTRGFRPQTFAAIVDGTMTAIARAHDDLAPAQLRLVHGELHDASTNRSPSSFDRNPPADRAHFPDRIDPQTTLLRIERDGHLVGTVNWFATHGTSMTNHNRLISADNKGYAAYHWERLVAGADYLARGRPPVITAFAQTNAGDMSPNLQHAPGRGPTDDEVENTRLIGRRQYDAAARLAVLDDVPPLPPIVVSRATRIDLSDVVVSGRYTTDGRAHRTGRPVAAAAQFAGTDEGPGFPGFRQGLDNPVWDAVSRHLWYRLWPALRAAHAPKAVVLPAWLVNRLHPMVAERVPVQLWRLGVLYLIGIPGEVTIVAGLRLRRAVADVVGAPLEDVLVAGYANAYIHYVTTPEEYDGQRYEAGSTMFGRWELGALTQTAVELASAMASDSPAAVGVAPTDGRRPARWGRRRPADTPAGGSPFGRVVLEPRAEYRPGDEASATFVSAHLSHDLRRGGTFLEVQRSQADDELSGRTPGDGERTGRAPGDGEWERVADDGDFATTLRWRRAGRTGAHATVGWRVPADVRPGWYRLVHHATALAADGTRRPFTGTSRVFTVR